MQGSLLGYLLLAPTVLLLGALLGWPLVHAIILSFYNVHPLTLQTSFAGLDNYRLLVNEPSFWNAVRNNFIWLAGSLVLQVIGGVGVALLLNRSFPGRGLARSMVLFPYLMPTVVTALIWQWMLEPIYGVVNFVWGKMGFAPPDWLGSTPE